MNFLDYILKAFLFRWNLLAVGSGVAFGIISGYADIILPLVGAGEVLYLAVVATHPRFQAIMNAEKNADENRIMSQISNEKSAQILSELKQQDRRRFEQLKELCLELRRIARRVKGDAETDPAGLSEIQISGINRLLWIYLNLLYSKSGLEYFFKTVNIKDIESDIEQTKERIMAMGPQDKDTPAQSKRRNSLLDTYKTSELRMDNYRKSMENYDFIGLELDRLYSKISSLAEMGINRQDPDVITSEIDVISASVHQAENAINELEFLTGYSFRDQETPSLLEEK